MVEVQDSLLYAPSHEWIRIEGDIGIIGITDFAQSQLGDIVYIELPETDENIFMNSAFGSIESVKTVSELIAPVNGNIIETNEELAASPELINKDPYNNGWLIKIKIEDKKQIEGLLSPGDYEDMISGGNE
ncbi:MAG: glycine cleavage system protein GcvH [Spirochaetes bacterium]|nr:glycine cleavage system protein GcvH [Spirochaetota bacterium]